MPSPQVPQDGPADVLAHAERAKDMVTLTPEQRAGMGILVGVAVLAVIAFAFIGISWVVGTPRPPVLPDDPQRAQVLIANYKTLADAAHESTLKLFDATVAKVLLPVFTLILGYVFGNRAKAGEAT